jgi:cephalosporin hydroxylase
MTFLAGYVSLALDELDPVRAEVGYGNLGRHGWLGYEDARVIVAGRTYTSALSTHPPARLRFAVPAGCVRLRCWVALNDDVAGSGSHATFTVVADGRVAAEAKYVRAGAAPVPLVANLPGASMLDLVVSTTSWAYCHAVWLEPVFDMASVTGQSPGAVPVVSDPLLRADIVIPEGLDTAEQCIATVGSAGFEPWVDDLLGSVRTFAGCPEAHLVVFVLGDAPALEEVANRHQATVVRCRPRLPLNPTCKSVLYAVASVIPAERFICLDADMLVLARLDPLFGAIDACLPGAILACGEGNDHGIPDLATALDVAYGGGPDPPFFARESDLGKYPLVINDGLLAGSSGAFGALDAELRRLPDAVRWLDERGDIRWRNQFAANVALARMVAAAELDPTWNVQLHVQDVEVDGSRASWRGRDVRVLHFSGNGKLRYGSLREAIRGEARFADLASRGRFEDAIGLGRALAASGRLSGPTAERLASLEAAMATPTAGSAEVGRRPWASEIPRPLLVRIQQGVHHQRYRGRQLVKSPFDVAMYQQLLERQRPATIVEIGSKDGGSALWLAGLAAGLGLTLIVHSYDLSPVTDLDQPSVRFHVGDGRHLADAVSADDLASWPRPWLVIDDADHAEPTTAGILGFFHPHLLPGDMVVVEDGNLSDIYPELFPGYTSGPHLALRKFLAAHASDYEIAAELCDLFGHNATTASNGILRRRQAGPGSQDPSPVLAMLRAQPWRSVQVPEAAAAVPTMLSYRELQLLHWLARDYVTGAGRIVDGGSFLGGSTAALASGLAARADGPWDAAITSYDMFRVEGYTLLDFATALPDPTIGASFRPAFDANIAPWARYVEVNEGDACAIGWSGEPIEVLFLDMVKTWQLNDLVLAQFLPCLIPGRSVIVQQDYLWGYGHWIHLTMELLDGCVEQIDAMANGSVAYLLTAPVPADLIGARLAESLDTDRQRQLMDHAVERWQGDERGLVELARAMMIAEFDGKESGLAELNEVLARHAGSARVEHCAAISSAYLR